MTELRDRHHHDSVRVASAASHCPVNQSIHGCDPETENTSTHPLNCSIAASFGRAKLPPSS